jgi:hypothetical protein
MPPAANAPHRTPTQKKTPHIRAGWRRKGAVTVKARFDP